MLEKEKFEKRDVNGGEIWKKREIGRVEYQKMEL